ALLDVAFDVRPLHARRDVPVDAAHLVARLVLAHLGELHPLPLEHRAVLAGEERVDEPARSQLEQLDLAEHFGWNGDVWMLRHRGRTRLLVAMVGARAPLASFEQRERHRLPPRLAPRAPRAARSGRSSPLRPRPRRW